MNGRFSVLDIVLTPIPLVQLYIFFASRIYFLVAPFASVPFLSLSQTPCTPFLFIIADNIEKGTIVLFTDSIILPGRRHLQA